MDFFLFVTPDMRQKMVIITMEDREDSSEIIAENLTLWADMNDVDDSSYIEVCLLCHSLLEILLKVFMSSHFIANHPAFFLF